MYRVRLHGREGQDIETAGRILGSALFRSGFEAQEVPRHGAQRHGAPVCCCVRAARGWLHERGTIPMPDLVAVSDDTLIGLPTAGVTAGLTEKCTLLVLSEHTTEALAQRTPVPGRTVSIRPGNRELARSRLAGAAARLLGVIPRAALDAALAALPSPGRAEGRRAALAAFDELELHSGSVPESSDDETPAREAPDWITLDAESASLSAPALFT